MSSKIQNPESHQDAESYENDLNYSFNYSTSNESNDAIQNLDNNEGVQYDENAHVNENLNLADKEFLSNEGNQQGDNLFLNESSQNSNKLFPNPDGKAIFTNETNSQQDEKALEKNQPFASQQISKQQSFHQTVIESLKKENEQLRSRDQHYSSEIEALKKENEILKKENEQLRSRDQNFSSQSKSSGHQLPGIQQLRPQNEQLRLQMARCISQQSCSKLSSAQEKETGLNGLSRKLNRILTTYKYRLPAKNNILKK